MKKKITIFIILALLFNSCNETDWLKEKPLDFLTPQNVYVTKVQFQQALNFLHDNYRFLRWGADLDFIVTLSCTDYIHGGYDFPDQKYNNYRAWITPESNHIQFLWTTCYKGIGSANVILERLQLASEISEADKAVIQGEALFFRALYFNMLATMYGGVPITTEVISEPKRDFTRNSRIEVYEQCSKDLEEASLLLNDIENTRDGAISKQAAQHLLAEVYISLNKFQESINASTSVINHPGMKLMTHRFGSRKEEPGDVYWDLFRLNNQNRSTSGNTETIWALQYELFNSGSSYSANTQVLLLPGYFSLTVESKNSPDEMVPAFTGRTAEKGGGGIGNLQPNPWFFNSLWDDSSDIRKSDYNIIKDFRIDNPEAKGFGQWFVKDGWLKDSDTIRMWYPAIQKFSTTGNFPDDALAKNPDGTLQKTALGEHVLNETSLFGRTSLKDEYVFRLAETYLLRAEAYLRADQKEKAVADINILRARSLAAPISASKLDIDFILDERLRELYSEEVRLFTLCRMGKMVERTRKYNLTGYNIDDHQNLWPIPYGEIEKNTLAKMEQNPGY